MHSPTLVLAVALAAIAARPATVAAQATVGTPPASPAPPSRIIIQKHPGMPQHPGHGMEGDIERTMKEMETTIEAAAEAAAEAGERAQETGERPAMRNRYASLTGSRRTRLFKQISVDPEGLHLPPSDSIGSQDMTIANGAVVGRTAAIGRIDVHGTVRGDVVAIGEDIVVHPGGRVTGDALSVGGTVRLAGGVVEGEMRSIDRAITPMEAAPVRRSGFLSILGEMQDVMGWLVLMVLLGFGALVFAEDRLRVVTETIEQRFGRSMTFGLIAQVSFIPLLVLIPLLLVITIVGILLAPFAVVAFVLLAAALGVLGFLAVSRVAGQALTRSAAPATPRGVELRSMLAGLFFFFGLWLLAAMLGWVPVLGSVLQALAVVLTWAGATVGLGAAVISRGGGRRQRIPAVPDTGTAPDVAWQTPTPISGIAGARRSATPSNEA